MVKPRIHTGRRWTLLAACSLLAVALAVGSAGSARADVIVLANRTGGQLALRFQPAASPAQQLSLAAGEVRPMFVQGRSLIEFNVLGQLKQYQLDVNSAYFFGRDASGRVDMQKIGLGEETNAAPARAAGAGGLRANPPVITVKILVDEEEPALQYAWEARLRRRVEAASEILYRHSGVRLKIVGVGTWNSDNSTNDFITSLTEFEKEVDPFPARLAIGFTSQFSLVLGRVHMAGTRGPLHSHILVREGAPQIGEPERLEFLVHELGHFLGAAHSPEKASVMRPVLGDNQAGRTGFQIRFDPVNTLVIASIGEEMGRGNIQKFADLPADTKRRLQTIYAALARSLPEDPAGGHFMRLAEATTDAPLANNAQRVLRGIVYAATMNGALLPEENSAEGQPSQRAGDALTQHLVRHAAGLADTLPDEIAPSAFLLALAVGLDDSNTLQQFNETRSIAQSVEPPVERALRLRMLGKPTMAGRRELARRFFAAAYLAAAIGPEAAHEAAMARELGNSAGGIDFALVAADRAGIRWGADVNKGRYSMALLSDGFTPALFMPSVDDLPVQLSAAEYAAQFGSKDDQRFRRQLLLIDQRIGDLPPYRRPGAAAGR
jgi:hypothetical protein